MNRSILVLLTSSVVVAGIAYGQGRGAIAGWTTSRGDAQRTAWVRDDAYISVAEVQKPGFGLQWSVKVGHTPRETLSEGVGTNTIQLNPQPGNVTGSANNLYAYEVDTGAIVWTKHFDGPAAPATATAACPGGLTAGVTRTTNLNQTVIGGGPGRATGGRDAWKGGVGAPGEGVPAPLMVGRGGRGGSGVARGGSGGGGGGANGLRGMPTPTYVISSDGVLHTVGQAQGKEMEKPIPFLPANANATDPILIDQTQVLYTSTINNCGGVANGVWALNIPNATVASWKSGASPAGAVAFSTTGTLFVAIGDGTAGPNGFADAIVALDPKTLAVKDSFTMPGASFSTTPVIFSRNGKELLAAATKDGRVFLFDTAALKTPLATSAATTTSKTWSPSALATWEDSTQTRWLALPAAAATSGLVALKVTGDNAKPEFQQGWSSSAIASPSAPVVVHGVVFAANTGSATAPAVLYALDATTGKELWNSGKAIKSYSRAGLWAINGQVHVATNDAMIYAFGASQGRSPGQ